MKNKHKNLEEQIYHMKSLMTEERLYGNMIEKPILVESKGKRGKLLEDIFTPIWRALLKNQDEIVLPSLKRNGDEFKLKKVGDDIEVYKKTGRKGTFKKLANAGSIGELVDDAVLKQLKGQINSLTKGDIKKFFDPTSEINYKKQMNIMLTDLEEHGLISPNSGLKQDILQQIDDSGVMGILESNFYKNRGEDGIAETVLSSSQMKNKYPETYSYLESLPGGAELILKKISSIKGTPFFSDGYHRFLKLVTKPDQVEHITHSISDNILFIVTKNGRKYKIPIDKMTTQERKILEYITAKDQITAKGIGRNPGEWHRAFKMAIEDLQIKKVDDIDNIKIANVEEIPTIKTDDLAIVNSKQLSSGNVFSTQGLKNAWVDWNIKKYGNMFQRTFVNGIKSGRVWAKIVADHPTIRTLQDIIPVIARKGLDINLLKRTGWSASKGTKHIDAGHQALLNKIWKTTKVGDDTGDIFVRGQKMKDLYGLPEGSIKTGLEKKSRSDITAGLKKGRKGGTDAGGNDIIGIEGLDQYYGWAGAWRPKITSDLAAIAPTVRLRNAAILATLLTKGYQDDWAQKFVKMLIGLYYSIAGWFYESTFEEFLEYVQTKVSVESRIRMARNIFVAKCRTAVGNGFAQVFSADEWEQKLKTFLKATGCDSTNAYGETEKSSDKTSCIFYFEVTPNMKTVAGMETLDKNDPVTISSRSIVGYANKEYPGIGKIIEDGGSYYLATAVGDSNSTDWSGARIPLDCGGPCGEEEEEFGDPDPSDRSSCGFEEYIEELIINYNNLVENPTDAMSDVVTLWLQDGKELGEAWKEYMKNMMDVKIPDVVEGIKTKAKETQKKIEDYKDGTGGSDIEVGYDD